MAAFSHKSPDDNYLLSTGHNCGISDTSLPSRVPELTFIQPSVDFHTTSPLTVSAASYSLEPQYSYPGTNTVVARETEEYSLQKLDSREIDEDIHKLFVETNVFGIDELYSNNIPPDVSMIFDEAIATTDSKEVAQDQNSDQYRPRQINSRMEKTTCRGSEASTESASKQPAMPKPVKDIVRGRPRRGQATDKHSVAERDILNVYRMYSELIPNNMAEGGPFASKTSYVILLRSVRRETLKLIKKFVDKAEDQPHIGKQFVQPMMDPLLGDYAQDVSDAGESEVLSLFGTVINKYRGVMMKDVPRIFDVVFACTLEMITKNFEDYPENRLKLFSLLHATAIYCFHDVFIESATEACHGLHSMGPTLKGLIPGMPGIPMIWNK